MNTNGTTWEHIVRALDILACVAPARRGARPILQYAKVAGGYVRATDLEIHVRVPFPDGSGLLPVREVQKAAGRVSDACAIVISPKEFVLADESRNYTWRATNSPDDFPEWPTVDKEFTNPGTWEIQAPAFQEALPHILHHIAKVAKRDVIRGGYLVLAPEPRLIATDNERIYCSASLGTGEGGNPVVLPTRTLTVLAKILGVIGAGSFKVTSYAPEKIAVSGAGKETTVTCSWVWIEIADVQLAVRVLEETFPDYTSTLRVNAGRGLTVNAEGLRQAVADVTVAGTDELTPVICTPNPEARTLEVAFTKDNNTAKATIPASWAGEHPAPRAFNPDFLADTLAGIAGPCTIRFGPTNFDPHGREIPGPVAVSNDGDTRVLMPISLAS